MKLASFNAENLFDRVKVMNLSTWSEGKKVLNLYAKLNALFQKPVYSSRDKATILKGLRELGLGKSDESEYVLLRQNRGHLVTRPKAKPPEIVATGRDSWIGWLELKTAAVNEVATQNTARVIAEIDADIL